MRNKSKYSVLAKLSYVFTLCVGLLLTGLVPQAFAQQGSEPNAGEAAEPSTTGMSKQQLLTLIANEIVLAPGIGLRNVRLGEEMSAVQNRLGNPVKISKAGFTGNRTNLVYSLDSGTSIVLSGKKILDRISVSGSSSGLVRTSQGARFGMQSSVIRQIYKEPSKSRKSRLEYRQLGATFYLENDRVSRIDLYPNSG